MPATALRCRVCETEVALEAVGVCPKCFAPLEPVYDRDELARTATRERIAAGPSSLWRYAPLLPVAPPAEPRLAPGLTPLVRAPRLAEAVGVGELWLKLDTANPTHSFKDRVVGRRLRQGAGARLRHASRARRRATSPTPSPRARRPKGLEAAVFCPRDLEPEKLVATAVYGATLYAVDGTYDDCSRLTVELSFELDLGLRQRRAADVLRGRLEDARLRDRRAARLADADGSRRADRLRRPLLQPAPGFAELRSTLGLADGFPPRLSAARRRDARRWPRRSRRSGASSRCDRSTTARSLAIGSPADGDLAVRTARESGGAIHAIAGGRGRREHGAPRRIAPGSSARRRPASRSAACARPSGAASSAPATRSSCSSPVTG